MFVFKNEKGAIGPLEIIAIVVVLAVAGVLAWRISDADKTVNDTEANTSNVSTVQEREEMIENATDAATLKETELTAVGDFSGNGTATRVFKDGVFTHTVNAQLADPAEGKFYEGWLVSADGGLISTGELKKSESGAYVLEYTSEIDYSAYNDVFITIETSANGLDGVPETHVLEGSF